MKPPTASPNPIKPISQPIIRTTAIIYSKFPIRLLLVENISCWFLSFYLVVKEMKYVKIVVISTQFYFKKDEPKNDQYWSLMQGWLSINFIKIRIQYKESPFLKVKALCYENQYFTWLFLKLN